MEGQWWVNEGEQVNEWLDWWWLDEGWWWMWERKAGECMNGEGWMDGHLYEILVCLYWLENQVLIPRSPHLISAQPLVAFCSVPRTDGITLPISKFPQRPFVLSVEGSSAVVQLVLVSSHCNRTVISRLLDGNCTWTARRGSAPVMTSGASSPLQMLLRMPTSRWAPDAILARSDLHY